MVKVFCDVCGTELTYVKDYYNSVNIIAARKTAPFVWSGFNKGDPIACKACYEQLEKVYSLWKTGKLNPCPNCNDEGGYWEQGPNAFTTCTQCRGLREARKALFK